MTTTQNATADRYAAVSDRALAAVLRAEDTAEEHHGLDPFERISCRLHRRWIHQCVHSSTHVVAITGHRWCRDCECAASVSVDELLGGVVVRCTRCLRVPASAATRQLVRACRASLAAATA